MSRIKLLIDALREIGSRDCTAEFDGTDHHSIMVAAAEIERLRAALTWISLGPGYYETKEKAVLEMMRKASETLK
jgi:hypothetical protein